MDELSEFISEYTKRLSRPVLDLDDVRGAMSALDDIRHNEIRIDMTLGPVEVRYGGKWSSASLCLLYSGLLIACKNIVECFGLECCQVGWLVGAILPWLTMFNFTGNAPLV